MTNKKQLCNGILWLVSAIFATFILIKVDFPIERIVLLEFVFLFAIIIHLLKGRKNDKYLSDVIGIGKKENRDYRYDHIRVLAVIFVILVHTIQSDIDKGLVTEWKTIRFIIIISGILLSCNILYIMLSAALLIPFKEEKLSTFYLRRVAKVFIPMFVYYLVYLWQGGYFDHPLSFKCVVDVLKYVYFLYIGLIGIAPHYWLIYIILALYIAVPFLRYMFKDMPYNKLTALAFICWFLMLLERFRPYFGFASSFFASWTGIAVMGYWVCRPETRKWDKLLIAMGLIAILAEIGIIMNGGDYMTLCVNCSPVVCSMALGIFAFVFSFDKIFKKGNFILQILSKYSYSIILIHWWILFYITREKIQIFAIDFHGFGSVISLLITLGLSLLAAFLIDNLVIVVVEQIYIYVIKGIETVLGKCKPHNKEVMK